MFLNNLETRLVLVNHIFNIESDLRNVIKKYIIPSFQYRGDKNILNFLSNEIEIVSRFEKSKSRKFVNTDIEELTEYIDFQESWEVIFKNKIEVPQRVLSEIIKNEIPLIKLVPVRNELAHSRPYSFESKELIDNFIEDLKDESIWYQSINFKNQLKSNSNIKGLVDDKEKLKSFRKERLVYHNLPNIEFDETGFVGREDDIEKINQLLNSRHPVISIIGVGGAGKSALALKIAYDLIENEKNKFNNRPAYK